MKHYKSMENDKDQFNTTTTPDQNPIPANPISNQIVQNQVNQPIQLSEKSRKSNQLIFIKILGVPIFIYILFLLLVSPINLLLQSVFYGDTKNVALGGLAILAFNAIILTIFFGLICGLLVYILTKKLIFFFVGFGIFILIIAVHNTITTLGFKNYLSIEVKTALNNVDEVVGKEKMIFTYVNSEPIYNGSSILDEVKITYKIIAPKTGDYQIDTTLATPYVFYGSKDQGIPKADTFNKTTVSPIEGIPFDLIISLKMKPFVDVNYEGKLNLDFRVWRTNIQIKDVAWSKEPITSWPVKIRDSGKSPNYKVSKDYGPEEPIYSIGPFLIYRP